MKIDSAFTVAVARDALWTSLNDVELVASCIPGCEKIERLSETSYRAQVLVALGVVKARFNLVVEVTGQEPPHRILFTSRGEEGSRASIVQSDNSMTLEAVSAAMTEVRIASDVSVTGRLGKFGLGVMRKKTESMTQEFAQALQARLAGGTTTGEA